MKKSLLFLFALIIFFSFTSCDEDAKMLEVNIIPEPVDIRISPGSFEINKKTEVFYSNNKDVEQIAIFLIEELKKYGIDCNIKSFDEFPDSKNAVIFDLSAHLTNNKEAYTLRVTDRNIVLSASNPQGLFYAFQSLKQMFPVKYSDEIHIPKADIYDEPRFKWRGMHLDVCRHFMPKEYVKKYIDYSASMKMNTFHWHLTEDQGWRIEIKAFPKLTEIGAWRKETVIGHAKERPEKFDGIRHGGYYTQEEIKEIVRYAKDRFITIVPEIEMPGHAQAAIASYPIFGCTGEQIDVWTTWGVSPYIYNVEDTTFKFLETVLTEVMNLFPGKYIHIGGDEAVKDQWKSSKDIQTKINELRLKDEHELQSYFIKWI